jgi:hypothetical protein
MPKSGSMNASSAIDGMVCSTARGGEGGAGEPGTPRRRDAERQPDRDGAEQRRAGEHEVLAGEAGGDRAPFPQYVQEARGAALDGDLAGGQADLAQEVGRHLGGRAALALDRDVQPPHGSGVDASRPAAARPPRRRARA